MGINALPETWFLNYDQKMVSDEVIEAYDGYITHPVHGDIHIEDEKEAKTIADLLNSQADEIASAREAQRALGAEASAMREALIEIADFWSDTDKYPDAYEGLPSKATMALESTTAGADLLAELERLRAIADKFIVLMQAGSRPEKDMWKLLDAAKAARGGEG